MSRRGAAIWIWTLVITGVLAAVAMAVRYGGSMFQDDAQAVEGVAVQRGELRISQTVRGNLEAKNSVSLKSEIEGRSTILFLMEEGQSVREGDLVIELDVSELVDRRVAQEIALQNARAAYTTAREQYDIQAIQNTSDIEEAAQKAEFARDDLERHLADDGERKQEDQAADEKILLKKADMSRAEDRLKWTRELAEKSFVTLAELETDEAAYDRARIEWEQAVREKTMMVKYGHPRKQKELESAIVAAERDLETVKKQSVAKLADREAARESAEARLQLEEQKLLKLQKQIEKGRILAPVDGMVVYSQAGNRWSGREPIQEGTTVYERQEIATIPRAGGMIAAASLHETLLEDVGVGQRCTISIDAIPGEEFGGVVAFVALLPDSGRWFSDPNKRVYKADISIDHTVDEMRPGMSCSVEILSEVLEDVLYVPVQSVFMDAGAPVCFVRAGGEAERREVEVGRDNARWVVVEKGLREAEVVLLSPPPGFHPSGAASGEGDSEEEPEPELPIAQPEGQSAPSADPDQESGRSGGRPEGPSSKAGFRGAGRPAGGPE